MTTGQGDADARFELLYRKHYRRMLGFVRSLGVAGEHEDVTQEVFKRCYEAFAAYRAEAEWAFLERIARNVVLNRIRARNTDKRKGTDVAIDDPGFVQELPDPEEPDYIEEMDERRRKALLKREIETLPPGQQQCLLLWLDGLKYDEIAVALRITMDAVKSRIRDAKRTLQERLQGDDGGTFEWPDHVVREDEQ